MILHYIQFLVCEVVLVYVICVIAMQLSESMKVNKKKKIFEDQTYWTPRLNFRRNTIKLRYLEGYLLEVQSWVPGH